MNRKTTASRSLRRLALAVLCTVASTAAGAQTALPPAQNLDTLERMVIAALGADIGQVGGPLAPLDRRMRLADCGSGVQIDPPSIGAVTVRCPGLGWRLRVPLARSVTAIAPRNSAQTAQTASLPTSAIRRGDPVKLLAVGDSYSISVDATAMEDADIGGRVRVSTAAKGSTLFAEVIDIGRVRLLGFK
ncbi:flagella basal body P-ring formation protein FlgA [Rhizorhabdus sp.]|jgi:flagella basal body P-ring formation protein FlgA|uniref:flagella basal body P-ring formation protein FlgA n=1 Tax=Rhizorhabdus sp. TaxID=1968843 RepID=UPI001B75B77A|nr:flagella basal body P-ring formation protein FlgA [Rhizorhabdus sp.]MBP8232211.1 flagella basal body P-ring formation protein FlgA [Rhizorhabdus sp.]